MSVIPHTSWHVRSPMLHVPYEVWNKAVYCIWVKWDLDIYLSVYLASTCNALWILQELELWYQTKGFYQLFHYHIFHICKFSHLWKMFYFFKDTKQPTDLCLYVDIYLMVYFALISQIAKFMGPTWGPPGSCRPHILYPPTSTKLKMGYTGFTLSVRLFICPSVCLSFCGKNCVCSVSSTILARSISYLHIFPSNFRRCVECNVFFFKISRFGKFFKFVNFTLSCFHLGSDMNL